VRKEHVSAPCCTSSVRSRSQGLSGWGLRAGWMAQELLTPFAEDLGSVTLTPDRTDGVFEVRIYDEVIWSRKERGRCPEIKEIKQLVRDRVAPGRPRGHTDTPNPHEVK
jgi:selenoprotein W-related protein